MKSVLAGLAILALVACNAPTDATWSFRGRVDTFTEPPAEMPDPQVVVLAPGVLTVQGFVTTPCWNDLVRLDGDRSGDNLTVTIDRRPEQPCTDTRVRTHKYIATFAALNATTFTVTVVNQIDNPAGVVIFQGTATID